MPARIPDFGKFIPAPWISIYRKIVPIIYVRKHGGISQMEREPDASAAIEITSGMIEAGVVAFYDFDNMPPYADSSVRGIVEAIVCAILLKSRSDTSVRGVHK